MADTAALTRSKEQANEGVVKMLIAKFFGVMTFASPRELEPTASASAPASLVQRAPPQLDADSTVGDITREPDEDLVFLSPQSRSGASRSAPGSSNYGRTMLDGTAKRRQPLYTKETSMRNQEKKKQRLQALRNLETNSLELRSSRSYADSSISGLSSPADVSFRSNPTPYNNVPGHHRHQSYINIQPGLSPDYANYSRLVNKTQFGDAQGVRDLFPYAHAQRAPQDLLAPRLPTQARQGQADVEGKISIARDALKTPLPRHAKLPSYRKSKLRDEQASEHIENLSRRRRIWPARMSEDNEKIIKAILRQAGVISSLPAAEVAQKDIVKLAPGEWLNDEVINFYGVMVNLRSAAIKARRDKGQALPGDEEYLDVHVFSSFFFQKLVNSGYAGVKKWSKRFDFFAKDIVILPINLGNAHWVCAAINVRLKRFEYYDSMGKINHNCLGKLREYVEGEHLEKKKKPIDLSSWIDYSNPRTPQQANGYDCGVFTSQFIECLSRREGAFDFDQKNMPYLRQKMIHEIKLMDLVPEQWFDPNKP